jgi:hypothetical protein
MLVGDATVAMTAKQVEFMRTVDERVRWQAEAFADEEKFEPKPISFEVLPLNSTCEFILLRDYIDEVERKMLCQ